MKRNRSTTEVKNPWRRLGRRHLYRNAWFELYEDDVIRPDGEPGIYGVVKATRWAIGVLPLWPDRTITLVGQYRYPLDEYSWEIPEGGGNLAEDPLVGARRELSEETGIEAGSWKYLGRCHTSNCFVHEVGHLFLAEDLVQGTPSPDPDEELRTQRLPLSEAMEMATDGRITDALSIVGLFRLARYLKLSR